MQLLFFIYGIVIGSFLNVCIYRIPKEASIVYPSSYCPKCNSSLKWFDLVPIGSYLLMGGRCRYCKGKIPLQYPLMELLNGLLWLVLFLRYGLTLTTLEYCIMFSLLVVISAIDIQHQIIPDQLILLGFGIVVLFSVTNYMADPFLVVTALIGGLLAGGFFLVLAIVTKGGMGGGDIKLMALLGFWLGWKWIMMVILLSFVLGSIISVFLLISKLKGRKDMIPFGPFISIATLITILYGNELLGYYLAWISNS